MPVKVSQEIEIDTRLEQLLAKTGVRDRTVIEKHLLACEAATEAGHALLWRRLVVKLGELVSLPPRVIGSHTLQFFVPDGKYRMQLFALDDGGNGLLSLFMPNILAKAVNEKLLVKSGDRYAPANAPTLTLLIQQMDVSNSNDPPEYMKHMIGWNRKAVKLTLPVSDGDSPLIDTVEKLCTLAAKPWKTATAQIKPK